MEAWDPFEELNELSGRLKDLDERGLVLTLAAFAEDSLGHLLKVYMVDAPAARKLVDGYDAPLSTLSARIRAACALGLLTQGQYHDLENLRTVRNMFSHTWRPISLDDAAVKKHVNAIHYSNVVDQFPATPREKLEGSISFLLVELRVAVDQIRKSKTHRRVLGARLFAGLTGELADQREQCLKRLERIVEDLSTAKGERKVFLKHLKKCWIEKYMRAVSHGPKDEWLLHLERLRRYASAKEMELSNLYT